MLSKEIVKKIFFLKNQWWLLSLWNVCHCENSTISHHNQLHSACAAVWLFLPSDCFQALRCQEPLPGPGHRQPQTQQGWRQTPHAPGAGHHRLKDQVRVRPPPHPAPPTPLVSQSRASVCPLLSAAGTSPETTWQCSPPTTRRWSTSWARSWASTLTWLSRSTTLTVRRWLGGGKHLDSPISAAPWQFWWGQAALWCKQRLPQTRRPSDVLRSQPRLNAATANILVEYRKKCRQSGRQTRVSWSENFQILRELSLNGDG